jgi:hypothetical protein
LVILIPTEPFAAPNDTGTVHVVPLPVGVPTVAPVVPVPEIVKLEAFTPVTASLKVTVKSAVAPPAGLAPARVIETTFGAIV